MKQLLKFNSKSSTNNQKSIKNQSKIEAGKGTPWARGPENRGGEGGTPWARGLKTQDGRILGILGVILRVSEVPGGALGGRLGSSWHVLGPSWRRLGTVLSRLGAVLGRLGGVLGRLVGLSGRLGSFWNPCSSSTGVKAKKHYNSRIILMIL